MRTTLNKIRKHGPCTDGWGKLLRHLGKTMADDEPLSITTVLDSNGLDDALWCLRAVDGCERDLRLYAVWCARQVQHLMTDYRSIRALDVAERYSHGSATDAEMAAARAAASDAARAAARAASDASWDAARAAEVAARAAAWADADAARAVADAARAAAWAAARVVEVAASDAASDAARAVEVAARAAEDAASDAAWDAARAAQEAELRRLCAMTDRELLELAAKAAEMIPKDFVGNQSKGVDMITVKDLMENSTQSSPDGVHWEPVLPQQIFCWRIRLRDAWAVWKGNAVAVRQTIKDDLKEQTND